MISLVIRDPTSFTSSSPSLLRRVPSLSDLRLFTSGSDSGDLVERCLFTGSILSTTPIPAAPIWSLAVAPTHDTLAIATSSDHVYLYKLDPDTNEVEVASPISRFEGLPGRTRTLSIAWGPPVRTEVPVSSTDDVEADGEAQGMEWKWKNTYIVTGNSDSSLRKWNVSTGRLFGRMSVSKIIKKKGTPAKGNIVWAVGVLNDHTIISCDSVGNVTFWDGRALTPNQVIKAHSADAMCIAINASGTSVFTSGPDQKIAEFIRVSSEVSDNINAVAHGTATTTSVAAAPQDTSTSSQRTKWMLTTSKRVHQHDIRALAIFPPYVPQPSQMAYPLLNANFTPILASGGLDMQVMLTPAASAELLAQEAAVVPIQRRPVTTFAEAQPNALGYMPGGRGSEVIASSAEKRLILVRRYRSLGIWRINPNPSGEVEGEGDDSGITTSQAPFEHLLEVSLQLRSSLVSAALSPNGEWMAVSDLYETKLFRVKETVNEDGEPSIALRRVKDFTESILDGCSRRPRSLQIQLRSTGSASLAFTPDSASLALGLSLSPHIVIVGLPASNVQSVEVLTVFDLRRRVESGRTVAGMPRNGGVTPNGSNKGEVKKPNGHANGMMDVDEEEEDSQDDSEVSSEDGSEDDDEDEDEEEEEKTEVPVAASILKLSEDGQWLATVDTLNRTSVYNLDLLKLHCVLPTFNQSVAAITFASARKLILAFPVNNTFRAYDLDERTLDSKYIVTGRTTMSRQPDNLAGICYSKKHRKIFAWGSSWVGSIVPGSSSKKQIKKKRRAGEQDNQEEDEDTQSEPDTTSSQAGVAVTQKFRNIGGVVVFDGELVVIERPFMDIKGLPQAFATRKYGT